MLYRIRDVFSSWVYFFSIALSHQAPFYFGGAPKLLDGGSHQHAHLLFLGPLLSAVAPSAISFQAGLSPASQIYGLTTLYVIR